MHPFLSSRKFIPFAHRGANYFHPENTLGAFKKAIDLGFTHIETDVRASKDGVPYIFHDRTLKRLTGEDTAISELNSSDIEKIRLRGSTPIPKLEEILEEFPKVFFNIDAKSWDVVEPLAKTINHFKSFKRICIASFNDYRILELRKLIEKPVCYSTGTIRSLKIIMMLKIGITPKIVEPCIQLPLFYRGVKTINKTIISRLKDSQTKLHVWGTNKEIHLSKLIDYGVDGIMVDDCVLLKNLLNKKNLW